MKKMIPVIIAIVLIFATAAVSLGIKLVEKYSYSKERADLEEYFNIEETDEIALILQDEMLQDKARLDGTVCYFSIDTVKQYFNSRFYEDKTEGLLLYTTPDDVIHTVIGSEEYTQNAESFTEDYVIAFYKGDKLYVAADYVKKFTNFSYDLFTGPNRMQVYTEWPERTETEIRKDTAIRYQGGVKSDILTDVKIGDTVVLLEEMENWSRVKTQDGFIGYVENKMLENAHSVMPEPVTDYTEPEYSSISKDYKINMVWHQVTNRDANARLGEMLTGTQGINTISPTWFSLNDNEGNFASISSADYVAQAHQSGMEVWGLVDNLNREIDSYSVLSSTSKRARLISGLMQEAMSLGLDGINVDFEQLSEETGEHFIQFIRELSIPCRANGLVLSVDNYVPTGGSSHYGRKEQGIVADYVIIMGYDEHWGGGGTAGSVASIDFVEAGIQNTLEEVPAEKVINAVPFYTRVWITENGTVTSEAVGMDRAAEFLSRNGVVASWDEKTCQNYAEFEQDGILYQVWLEDEQSIEVKLNVMKNYNLAGVAAWRLGYERPPVWNVIDMYVKN